jgi:O-antigen/teichoic acid export membrane protein
MFALYGVQACAYALPLLTFPYLARASEPLGWGVVVFGLAVGGVIASAVGLGGRYLRVTRDFASTP